MKKKYEIIKLGTVKDSSGTVRAQYRGINAAARGIKVCRQTVYDWLAGKTSAIGPKKRAMLVVVDLNRG